MPRSTKRTRRDRRKEPFMTSKFPRPRPAPPATFGAAPLCLDRRNEPGATGEKNHHDTRIQGENQELSCEMRPGSSTLGKIRGLVSPFHEDSIPDPQKRPNVPHYPKSTKRTRRTPCGTNPGRSVPCPDPSPTRAGSLMAHRMRNHRNEPDGSTCEASPGRSVRDGIPWSIPSDCDPALARCVESRIFDYVR